MEHFPNSSLLAQSEDAGGREGREHPAIVVTPNT